MREEAQHYQELLFAMTERELRARYKHTVFGFFWLIVNPILQMLVIGFIFTFFMKEPVEHYYLYLFTGLLVWNFFALSLTKATPSIVYERSLIKKAGFPRSVIPVSIIMSNFFHLILAQGMFLGLIILLGQFNVYRIIYLGLAYALLLTFTVGLSLLTTALNVRFRDVAFFVQALLVIWFYATPIVYSFQIIPYGYIWLWRLNPMTSILQLFQHAFIGFPMPGPAMLSLNILVTLIMAITGVWVFRKESKNFDDWV